MNKDWKTKLQEEVQPEYFFWAAVCLSLFFLMEPHGAALQNEVAAAAVGATTPESIKENPFDSVELTAKAAYVYDLKAKRPLFSKNALEPLPLASITKIMTAATALSYIPETTYITIGMDAIAEEGDSGLKVGERWILRDLLKFMLLESSNDGAAAVSGAVGEILATSTQTSEQDRALFVEKMNGLGEALGLRSTYFLNESGLDIDTEHAGAYSSAAETARMLAYALEAFPAVFAETRLSELSLQSEEGEEHAALNTNKGTNDLPLLIASKTGYTDLAGGNLVIAFDAGFNRPVIIAVLGSTEEERFTDVEKLVWSTLEYLAQAR